MMKKNSFVPSIALSYDYDYGWGHLQSLGYDGSDNIICCWQ